MPQITTFTLTDREATPVNHVFTAFKKEAGIVTAVRSTGVPGLDELFTLSMRDVNKYRKTRYKLIVPIAQTEVINGISNPREVRRNSADLLFTFDRYSTLQERLNIVGMMYSALSAAQAQLSPVSSGSETPY